MVKYAIAFYSGGKDSHYAVIKSLHSNIRTKYLLAVRPGRMDSWMFHAVNVKWVRLHSKAMGIPILWINVSGLKDLEVVELRDRLLGIRELLRREEIDYLISGAVASKYQKDRLDALAECLGLKHYTPLWGSNQEHLLKEELRYLSFMIVAVQAYGLDIKWLGRIITENNIKDLISLYENLRVSPVGEGGEFETFVVTSTLFRNYGVTVNKARLTWSQTQWFGYYIIEDAALIPL